MLKRLIAVTLAVAVLSTSVLAAGPTTEYQPAEDCAYEDASCCEPLSTRVEGVAEVARPISVMAHSGISLPPWAEPRTFDNPIDRIYFNTFREGFEIIQQHSTPVNQIITSGNIEMEVLSSVAIAGPSFAFQNWLNDDWIIFCEETGSYLLNEDAEYEEILINHAQVYTFFSLRDITGQTNLDWGTSVILADGFDGMFFDMPFSHNYARTMFGSVNFLYLDEATGIGYFVARHSVSVAEDANIVVDFTIERFLSDQQFVSEQIDIDFAGLAASHEATFITQEDSFFGWGGSASAEMREIMGEDFDPFSPDREFMAVDELSIHIFGDIYLTNIAVRDNLLHIQMSEPLFFGGLASSWTFVQLINPAVEIPVLEIPEGFDWDSIGEDFWDEMNAQFVRRYPRELFSIDVTPREFDEYLISLPDRRITERVFHFEDMDVINDLVFNASMSYFANIQDVNLAVQAFEIPVIGHTIKLEDIEVTADGDVYQLSNIQVSLMEIRFTVDGDGSLFEELADHSLIIQRSIHELFEITMVFADGIETPFMGWSGGSAMTFSEDPQTIAHLSISFGGMVIDVENLTGLRINGVLAGNSQI